MNKQDWKIFKKSFKEDWFLWLLQSIIIILIFGTLGFCIYSRFTNPQPVHMNEDDVELIMSNTVC